MVSDLSAKKLSIKLHEQLESIKKLWESLTKKKLNLKIPIFSFYEIINRTLLQFKSKIVKIYKADISLKNLKLNAKNLIVSFTNKKKYTQNHSNKKENSSIIKTYNTQKRVVNSETKPFPRLQETPTIKLKYEINESLLNKILNYLKKHREISLNQIAKDLQLPPSIVKKALTELEKTGKIKFKG
jgi:DNA-binding Lrp family transcriptional regulator